MMQRFKKIVIAAWPLGMVSLGVLASVSPLPSLAIPNNLIGATDMVHERAEQVAESSKQPTYSVLVENRCVLNGSATNMHFMVVNEEKRKAYNDGTNLTASITDHFLTAMAPGESQVFEFPFARTDLGLESSWRLWWDTDFVEFSRNQTLVELHCLVSDVESDLQRCNIDVSNVDGLTSTVQVKFPSNPFPPITLEPPSSWECPEPNRIGRMKSQGVPKYYLPEQQACLSNCSLLRTDSTCCPTPPYTSENCTNANPAFLVAAPETYTFAYDDQSVRCNGQFCDKPLRAYDFRQNSQIMHITTCFAS